MTERPWRLAAPTELESCSGILTVSSQIVEAGPQYWADGSDWGCLPGGDGGRVSGGEKKRPWGSIGPKGWVAWFSERQVMLRRGIGRSRSRPWVRLGDIPWAAVVVVVVVVTPPSSCRISTSCARVTDSPVQHRPSPSQLRRNDGAPPAGASLGCTRPRNEVPERRDRKGEDKLAHRMLSHGGVIKSLDEAGKSSGAQGKHSRGEVPPRPPVRRQRTGTLAQEPQATVMLSFHKPAVASSSPGEPRCERRGSPRGADPGSHGRYSWKRRKKARMVLRCNQSPFPKTREAVCFSRHQ